MLVLLALLSLVAVHYYRDKRSRDSVHLINQGFASSTNLTDHSYIIPVDHLDEVEHEIDTTTPCVYIDGRIKGGLYHKTGETTGILKSLAVKRCGQRGSMKSVGDSRYPYCVDQGRIIPVRPRRTSRSSCGRLRHLIPIPEVLSELDDRFSVMEEQRENHLGNFNEDHNSSVSSDTSIKSNTVGNFPGKTYFRKMDLAQNFINVEAARSKITNDTQSRGGNFADSTVRIDFENDSDYNCDKNLEPEKILTHHLEINDENNLYFHKTSDQLLSVGNSQFPACNPNHNCHERNLFIHNIDSENVSFPFKYCHGGYSTLSHLGRKKKCQDTLQDSKKHDKKKSRSCPNSPLQGSQNIQHGCPLGRLH